MRCTRRYRFERCRLLPQHVIADVRHRSWHWSFPLRAGEVLTEAEGVELEGLIASGSELAEAIDLIWAHRWLRRQHSYNLMIVSVALVFAGALLIAVVMTASAG